MKFDLSELAVLRFGATNKSILKQMFQPNTFNLGNLKSHVIQRCFIDIRWKMLPQFSAEKNPYLGFQVFELASLI